MVTWPTGVNTDAYGMNTSIQDNLVTVTFSSGKTRSYLKNSKPQKKFSFKLKLKDSGTSGEYQTFISWYENTCCSGSETFSFPDLITHSGTKEYRFTATPSASGQLYKEVTLNVIEE